MIEDTQRQQIAEFLPDAIKKAIDSYHRFTEEDFSTEEKKFSTRHTACKVALAHIELLLKLAKWAKLSDDIPEINGQTVPEIMEIAKRNCQISRDRISDMDNQHIP
jgi:hypothetical protein